MNNHLLYGIARVASVILALVGLMFSGSVASASQISLERVTVALKPDKAPDRMLEEKSALEGYLAKKLACPVEVIVPLSSAVITTGFGNGTIDFGYLSSTGAAKAVNRGVADILLVGEIDGKPHYMSYWIALKEKSYKGIEDLKGKPIAFSSRTSTSGFLIPIWDLFKKELISMGSGPEGFFGEGNVYYGVGYVSAAQKVLRGEADAAALSYYVLDEDRHLTEGQRSKLKMIAQQGPVPSHTISVRRTLSISDRMRIKSALLELNEENPLLRDKVFNSKLIEADPVKHLEVTQEALEIVAKMKL